jgi:hypothetical protein
MAMINTGGDGAVQVSRGLRYEPLVVAVMADGTSLTIPVHRLAGARPGPTLGLAAVVHGDETLPNEIIRRLLARLDADELAGTVLAIPVAYPPALVPQTRNGPVDMLDLNRSFPGDPGGWLTEQVAHAITQEFLTELDALVDLHSGGIYPTVDYVYALEGGLELAKVYGSKLVFLARAPHPGSMGAHAQAMGIPSVMVEIGGGLQVEEPFLRQGLRGLENVLKHYKMLPGEPEPPAKQLVFDEMVWLRPRSGGILHPEVPLDRLGTRVTSGELLGTVRSALTFEALEELRAPLEDGVLVLLRSTLSRINPGDFAYMIGNAAAVVAD